MIFNFRLASDEVSKFKREIKIDAQATFLDLKNAICDAVGYKKDEPASFFLCGDDWDDVDKEIASDDRDTASDQDIYLMDECVLEDYIDDEGQKLLYTFDYDNERSFFVEMKELITGKELRDPVCTLSLGTAPSQVYVQPKAEAPAAKAPVKAATLDDFDDPMYGDDEYSPEEFDENGFSELTEE